MFYRHFPVEGASQGGTQYFTHVVRDQGSRTIGTTASKVMAGAGGGAVGGVIVGYSISEMLDAFDNDPNTGIII